MRNEPFTLTTVQTMRLISAERLVAGMRGPVRLLADKRDGSPTCVTGPVVDGIRGADPSHRCVTVDTERGPRTVNLWAVHAVEPGASPVLTDAQVIAAAKVAGGMSAYVARVSA